MEEIKQRVSLYQQLIREEDINSAKLFVNIPTFSDGPIRSIQIEFAKEPGMGVLVRVIGHKAAPETRIEIKKTDNELLEAIYNKVNELYQGMKYDQATKQPISYSPFGDVVTDPCERHWMYNSFNCLECGTSKKYEAP